jgi:hypothetical protein
MFGRAEGRVARAPRPVEAMAGRRRYHSRINTTQNTSVFRRSDGLDRHPVWPVGYPHFARCHFRARSTTVQALVTIARANERQHADKWGLRDGGSVVCLRQGLRGLRGSWGQPMWCDDVSIHGDLRAGARVGHPAALVLVPNLGHRAKAGRPPEIGAVVVQVVIGGGLGGHLAVYLGAGPLHSPGSAGPHCIAADGGGQIADNQHMRKNAACS